MGGKRAAAKAHTRAKVIACARDLFATRGYEGTTVRDIAKAVGMSTGAVFTHFSGKDALFEVATGRKDPVARLVAILRARPGGCAVGFSPDDADQLLADLVGTP